MLCRFTAEKNDTPKRAVASAIITRGGQLSTSVRGVTEEIGHEQSYVSMLYERLDGMRERAERRRGSVLRQTGGTPQARSERESAARLQTEQVTRFSAVEEGLCFGRLDLR